MIILLFSLVVTETCDVVANQAITVLLTGLGWGLIGNISKPAIGMLDLLTCAATAALSGSPAALTEFIR